MHQAIVRALHPTPTPTITLTPTSTPTATHTIVRTARANQRPDPRDNRSQPALSYTK